MELTLSLPAKVLIIVELKSLLLQRGLMFSLPVKIAQPRTYPQLPLSFANGQLFGGAL